MRRARATQIIERLIAEANAINADDRMFCTIKRISVFGSYLTDKPVLGDLDIGVRLVTLPGAHTETSLRTFLRDFPPPRHIARDYMSRVFWPQTFVWRRLRVGRNISFHDQDEVEGEGYMHHVIFED